MRRTRCSPIRRCNVVDVRRRSIKCRRRAVRLRGPSDNGQELVRVPGEHQRRDDRSHDVPVHVRRGPLLSERALLHRGPDVDHQCQDELLAERVPTTSRGRPDPASDSTLLVVR